MRVPLSLAIGPYDHVRDLDPQGIDLAVQHLPVEEIFYRFTRFREWDAAEMSFAKTLALLSRPDADIVALPVFPSRVFRHSAIYVRPALRSPKDLEGKRVGIPEWAQTAGIYARGLLQHEYGVDLASISWVQAGVHQPGRV
jgi:4,5-dihydroxyphthalate decarboxylase